MIYLHVQVSGYTSKIIYTPRTELDFRSLLCWGLNSIRKGTPCMFSILPIGPQDPPSRCLSRNGKHSFKVGKKILRINITCLCSDICDGTSVNPNHLYSSEVKLATWESIIVLQNTYLDFQVVGLVSGTT